MGRQSPCDMTIEFRRASNRTWVQRRAGAEPEEIRQRGDAADALFREIVRRPRRHHKAAAVVNCHPL
jgi:hypothetical protein